MLAFSPVRSLSEVTSRLVQASEAATRGRLDGVWQAQAGLADGNGRQLALTLRFRRLQQSRQEDRANGFLDRLKRRPAVGHGALEVLPLLLE
jgi:hypothetical protein